MQRSLIHFHITYCVQDMELYPGTMGWKDMQQMRQMNFSRGLRKHRPACNWKLSWVLTTALVYGHRGVWFDHKDIWEMAPNAIFSRSPPSPKRKVTHKSPCGERDLIRNPIPQLSSFPVWPVEGITAVKVGQSRWEVPGLRLTIRKTQTSFFTNEPQRAPLQIKKASAYLARELGRLNKIK